MTLPVSGRIKLSDVNTELGLTSTTRISMNQSSVRTLFNISGGKIRLGGDGHGKANAFLATISSNQQELNLKTWALANGWNGSSSATITIASGVYIWSDNIAVAGLTTDGPWPAGLTIVNNGYIIGKGGGGGTYSRDGGPGATAGGSALSLNYNISLTNNSYIAGGGGGGGSSYHSGGGGGAGGGAGGNARLTSGGAGGSIGSAGSNGGGVPNGTSWMSGGGGGGRILPGDGGRGGYYERYAGTYFVPGQGGGAGGGGGYEYVIAAGYGGYGGSNSQQGNVGYASRNSGGGGGWGAAGGNADLGGSYPNRFAAAGGNAIALNGYSVTYITLGTIYGAVS